VIYFQLNDCNVLFACEDQEAARRFVAESGFEFLITGKSENKEDLINPKFEAVIFTVKFDA
jgi:hypothetical protein